MAYPIPTIPTLTGATPGPIAPRYWFDPMTGLVHFAGQCTLTDNIPIIFTITPADLRPTSAPVYMDTLFSTGHGYFLINTDGAVQIIGASGVEVFLNGKFYLAGI